MKLDGWYEWWWCDGAREEEGRARRGGVASLREGDYKGKRDSMTMGSDGKERDEAAFRRRGMGGRLQSLRYCSCCCF